MFWVLIRIASARYLLESPQQGDSNEYPQHMFLWRNKQIYPLTITKYPPYLSHCITLANNLFPSLSRMAIAFTVYSEGSWKHTNIVVIHSVQQMFAKKSDSETINLKYE